MAGPVRNDTAMPATLTRRRALYVLALIALLAAGGCTDKPGRGVPAGTASEHSACAGLTFAGFPLYATVRLNAAFVCHAGFAAAVLPGYREPAWVVTWLGPNENRLQDGALFHDFRADPDLPAQAQARASHLAHSGFIALQAIGADAYGRDLRKVNQSFWLSNAFAATPASAQAWTELDLATHAWARQRGGLFITAGAIFSGGQALAWIGQAAGVPGEGLPHVSGVGAVRNDASDSRTDKMGVPTHLYEVVFDGHTGQAAAFIVPNQNSPIDLERCRTTVAQVEAATGLRLFPLLAQTQRAGIETQYDVGAWPLMSGR